MKILAATHNLKKLGELKRILSPLGIEIITLDICEPDETGTTFSENARIKAESGLNETGLITVADDSGLCVDALGGRPGVYSARYAGGADTPYSYKIEYLLNEMKDVSIENRAARFVSSICCVFPNGDSIEAEGTCEGIIGFEPRGENGFGYDPVFYVGGKSFAELSPKDKDKISHRGKALNIFYGKLEKYMKGNNT